MKTIGYAIVGTGYFGAELGRIMKEQEGAKIVAVYDPENAETVAKELGCDVETDLDKLCSRDDVDAVLVASPNYLHKEPVLTAARHKKHVFCEKPIALCYADCDEMVRACKENGVIFMAGHVMNFFRAVRHTKQLIAEGKIGRVLYCHSARNGWEEPQPSISWKKIRAKSGGHLYHHIHELDCIQFLMGPATEVTMTGGNVAHKGEQFGDEDDKIKTATSLDGGETWIDVTSGLGDNLAGTNSQLSALSYSGTVVSKKDGQAYPAVLLSMAYNTSRTDGRIYVGLIKENGQYDNGSTKYSIDWEYVYQVTEASALFAYSSLVELGDGRIGMIYEASPTTSWADGLRYMYYEEFTMSELTAN